MARIRLIHWNGPEGRELKLRLASMGHHAEFDDLERLTLQRILRGEPPEAFVIDLSRLPAQGREVAMYVRTSKTMRHVPIVFVDGDPAKVKRVRELLPDATYTTWPRLATALPKAIARRLKSPVVPPSSIYTGRPVADKLGIKPGMRVCLIGAPPGFAAALVPTSVPPAAAGPTSVPTAVLVPTSVPPAAAGPTSVPTAAFVPTSVPRGDSRRLRRPPSPPATSAPASDLRPQFTAKPSTQCELFIALVRSRREYAAQLGNLAGFVTRQTVWVVWPKKASGVKTDLDGNVIRETGLAAGWVDFKICAIDETWSGLAFKRRK